MGINNNDKLEVETELLSSIEDYANNRKKRGKINSEEYIFLLQFVLDFSKYKRNIREKEKLQEEIFSAFRNKIYRQKASVENLTEEEQEKEVERGFEEEKNR